MKKFLIVIENIVLIISVFIVSIALLSNIDVLVSDDAQFMVAVPLTIIIVYVWRKIDKKFFK